MPGRLTCHLKSDNESSPGATAGTPAVDIWQGGENAAAVYRKTGLIYMMSIAYPARAPFGVTGTQRSDVCLMAHRFWFFYARMAALILVRPMQSRACIASVFAL